MAVDWLAVGPGIVAKLRDDGVSAHIIRTQDQIDRLSTPTTDERDTVYITYRRVGVQERRGDMQPLQFFWRTSILVWDRDIVTGPSVGLTVNAGPLIGQIVEALQDLVIEPFSPLSLSDSGEPQYGPGSAIYPIEWVAKYTQLCN
ncbi:MAG: hypothetical protein ACR2QC_02430 [Gammaproteobacteria bacterium]